ncbi:low density lipoprotein receptor adapter protein 1-like [Dendronephthya gigantea]|uniref:low density lipoprotein receptor adapter protein 1-like n=1 Tax=Dendronephthya gigantea TaxID=151771 RepID=UPI001068DF15|nr:low density lipoprotein receptor adapter protein 1-like [Dendronephthya gigantea]
MAFIGKAGRVADAVKRSPKVLRKKIERKFGSHETLQEDWLHENEALVDGISFFVKYLGCAPAVEAQGQGVTDEAVKRLLAEAKIKKSKGDMKLQKVVLTVTPKEIRILDFVTKTPLEVTPIFRVSYCTADPNVPKVFAFNSREKQSLQIRCRAFLCTKPKIAKAIALTVAQAFNVAFEAWETMKETKAKETPNVVPLIETTPPSPHTNGSPGTFNTSAVHTGRRSSEPLNDKPDNNSGRSSSFSSLPSVQLTPPPSRRKQKSLALDFSLDNGFDEEFTKLAKSRSNPHLLDIGFEKEEIRNGDWAPFLDIAQSEEDLFLSKSSEDLSKIHI